MMAKIVQDYPGLKRGIIIVFDEDGAMHSNWSCNSQQMALAAVRLAFLSGGP